jgi:hypothetical protein
MWAAMAFHCFPKEFQDSLAITTLYDEAFEHFPFMIHSPPKIVRLAVDLHEHLVQGRCCRDLRQADIVYVLFL